MTMTRKKAAWYNARAKSLGGYATASAVNKNKAADIYYRKSADALLEAFLNAALREVRKHYSSVYSSNAEKPVKSPSKVGTAFRNIRGRQMDLFTQKAEQIVVRYVGKVGKREKKNVQSVLERFFGLKLAVQYNAARYDEMLKVIIRRNVELLRNTASQVVDNVQSIVTDAMTTGQGWADIEHALKKQHEIAENRIKRIARDQTAKATEAVNVMMQRAAGAEYFEWSTSKDERVSTGFGGHKQLDGKIYRYDEPERYPIIDSYGNRGLPAQRVQCRCTALSVFIMDGYRAKWSKSDECYKIVKEYGNGERCKRNDHGGIFNGIPAGSLASDGTNEYELLETVSIPASGTVDVEFQAVEPGAIVCLDGSLTTIVSVISGWNTVTNAQAGISGYDTEADNTFRSRVLNTLLQMRAKVLLGSIAANVGQVENVLSVKVLDNPVNATNVKDGVTMPPYSIYVGVLGGAGANIAAALARTKTLGCPMVGNTVVTYYDAQASYNNNYKINRPTITPIDIEITYSATETTPANIQTVLSDTLLSYLADNMPQIGQTVSSFFLNKAFDGFAYAQIYSVKVKLHSDVSFEDYAVINADEIAQLVAGNISFTVV